MNFDVAFEKLIGHEGGYVNDARDPGGETQYGISKRAYPDEDIAGLTLERAKQIYRRDYWDAVQAEYLPDAVRFDLFDADGCVGGGIAESSGYRRPRLPDTGAVEAYVLGRHLEALAVVNQARDTSRASPGPTPGPA